MKKIVTFAAGGILAVVLLAHFGAFRFLVSSSYLPHRYCYLLQPGLVWTNVTMDGLIAASYGLVFACLFWIAGHLRRLSMISTYTWIFIAFGTFILACGSTHLMEMVTIWWPVYRLSAAVKVVCAIASVPTAILFAKATPDLASNIGEFVEMLSTTRREKEQAVLALMASEKLAVAGRLAAVVSHEIKNPLDSIGNLLYLVAQDERLPRDLLQLLQTANSELDRASSIARDTLLLFKTSGAPAPVPVEELVNGVLHLQGPVLVERDIKVQTRLRVHAPLVGYGGELRQVLTNLLQNALAVAVPGSCLLLRVQPRRSLVRRVTRGPSRTGVPSLADFDAQPGYSITIADSGSGIPAHVRDRLFSLFFTTKGDEGNGIGLWLVRSVVEKHGGRIRFRSRTALESPHTGTVFNIWIPLEPPHAVTEQVSEPAA